MKNNDEENGMRPKPMNHGDTEPQRGAADLAAAEWVLRHDRGLTAAEQDEFSQWLAADPAHRAAWAEHRWGWDELDRLAGLQTSVHAVPDPDLLAPKTIRVAAEVAKQMRSASSRRLLQLGLPLAAAAAVALGLFWWDRAPVALKPGPGGAAAPSVAPSSLARIEERTLVDGSIVILNRGAMATVRFSPGERRVTLERGEAHFKVVKDAARPFVVEAAGVAVRALGTAFNIRLDTAAVEVLVTEGSVHVNSDHGPQATDHGPRTTDRRLRKVDDGGQRAQVRGQKSEVGGEDAEEGKRIADEKGGLAVAPVVATPGTRLLTSDLRPLTSGVFVSAGERVVVAFAPQAPAPTVQAISPAEIAARLAWQPRLLDFTNAPLPEIVAEFNRRNPVRLALGDEGLSRLRLSLTFRSDNVEGFVRLMVSDFGLRAERREREEIVLYRAK